MISAYVNIPSFGVGDPYALSSVAAVVVGGTLLSGGVGSVTLSAAGVLFITQINALTNVMNVSTGGQYLIQAAIIILGVTMTRIGKKNKGG
jgi:ribose transport system permease protein